VRLVFDIQSLQSASRLRGIGRYTSSLISAILEEGPANEIVLLLNGSLGDADAVIADLRPQLPGVEFAVCHLPGPTAAYDPAHARRESLAELIREAFIAELRPDLLHVFSVLEGYEDNVVVSIGRSVAAYPVTATFYDLIPLLNPEAYLHGNKAFNTDYASRLTHLRRADGLLAISHFAAGEAAEHLGYAEEHIGVATLGPLLSKPRDAGREGDALTALTAVDLAPGFLLYVGGSDPRKNLPRLVEAWCALPEALQKEHPLVMAGSMPRQDVLNLKSIAATKSAVPAQLRFLGQISDALLGHLYTACAAFVFPSWHEGFGLPALEAMAKGAPVIAANTSSLPEVVGLEDALFDPFDAADLTERLTRVLTDPAYVARLRAHAPQQAAKFSWQNTARDALNFFERTHQRKGGAPSPQPSEDAQARWRDEYPERLRRLMAMLAVEIRGEPIAGNRVELISQVAAAIDRNEQQLQRLASRAGGAVSPWLIEGPFDSSYSLALLNRELARALVAAGIDVRLHSTEGPGDFDPDPAFLAQNPDVAALKISADAARTPFPVGSRLLYPPRVDDICADLAMLHLYGWEEGELPRAWVRDFNAHLGGITTMSRYVSKVLIDNGVTVPQAVAGVGVDHWERIAPDPDYALPFKKSGFTFLHVSSCFPRKGVDVLLTAWGGAFTREDNVTLVIKTFPNPHNTVREQLEAARRVFPNYPDVVLIETDLSDAELKALMCACDALVAPSRGEGFGLPIAEAMLAGLPVIATGYGGHMDFCDGDNAWLVDYSFTRARTHFEQSDSIWVEPDGEDLRHQLVAVHEATEEERVRRAAKGRERLLRDFTWARVGQRVVDSAKAWKQPHAEQKSARRIGWVSSWNTRCGIAGYSAYLLAHFEGEVSIYASRRTPEEELDKWLLPEDGPQVARCWSSGFGDDLADLREALFADLPEAVVIQFNYGFFEFPALAQLILDLKAASAVVVVVFHSTFDPPELPDRRLKVLADALRQSDRLLVHSPNDLNRLKAIGLTDNTALLPHGVMEFARVTKPQRGQDNPPAGAPFRMASFGFLLPHKGLEQLLDAVSILRQGGSNVVLHMLNAEYPAAVSREAIADIAGRVKSLGLESVVTLDTTYYTDEECLERLGRADLIVFPYQSTQESSSAAVRHAIASTAAVAVTPLDIFEDVAGAVIVLPGVAPEALAQGVQRVMAWDPAAWQAYRQRGNDWRGAHAHGVIARRLEGQLNALCSGANG